MQNIAINLYELIVKANQSARYDEIAEQTISASISSEVGTLAMYALKHKDDLRRAYMVELYNDDDAYYQHLNGAAYKTFAANAAEIIEQKQKITLVPQFVGDKHVIQDERTINNLVIVEVKPEFQIAFKNSVLPEMATSLDVEHGVLAIYAATDVTNACRWYFYEVYASEEDYQQHRQTPHFRAYITQTAAITTRKQAIPVNPVFLRNKGGMKSTMACRPG